MGSLGQIGHERRSTQSRLSDYSCALCHTSSRPERAIKIISAANEIVEVDPDGDRGRRYFTSEATVPIPVGLDGEDERVTDVKFHGGLQDQRRECFYFGGCGRTRLNAAVGQIVSFDLELGPEEAKALDDYHGVTVFVMSFDGFPRKLAVDDDMSSAVGFEIQSITLFHSEDEVRNGQEWILPFGL